MDLQDNEESIEELRCKLKEIEDDYANLDFFAQQIRKERNDFQARVNLLEASQQPRNEKCEVRANAVLAGFAMLLLLFIANMEE